MKAAKFRDIRHWVFDLDNTLYAPDGRLFAQIEVKMTDWVMSALNVARAEADRLRTHYWQKYGTTLAGLMAEHNVDPAPYLNEVHDIDLGHLRPDRELAAAIAALPGRKIVYTNGSAPYAARVLAARGLSGVFDAVYGVEQANFLPKPQRAAFQTIFERGGTDPRIGAMFEDEPRNLAAPHQMGMLCVHVAPKPSPAPHIHYHTANLAEFLSTVIDRPFSAAAYGPR
ncbi:MAG: pyrimidine 5'-nucleotidase [Paracoccaceae bacterium]